MGFLFSLLLLLNDELIAGIQGEAVDMPASKPFWPTRREIKQWPFRPDQKLSAVNRFYHPVSS